MQNEVKMTKKSSQGARKRTREELPVVRENQKQENTNTKKRKEKEAIVIESLTKLGQVDPTKQKYTRLTESEARTEFDLVKSALVDGSCKSFYAWFKKDENKRKRYTNAFKKLGLYEGLRDLNLIIPISSRHAMRRAKTQLV